MPLNSSSDMPSASLTPRTSAPRFGDSGRTAKGRRRSVVEFMAMSPPILLRTDIADTRWALEAADRFRQQLLRQPQHGVREEHAESDRQQEHDVERQRANQRLAEADPDIFRRHQQR